MKKVLLILLTFIMFVINCGKLQAQENLEIMLNDLQSGDISKIKKLNLEYQIGKENEAMQKVFIEGYKKMTYKIKDIKVEGDKKTVNLDIKVPDLYEYFPEYMEKLPYEFNLDLNKSDEEVTELFERYEYDFFMKKIILKDLKFTKANINLVLKKIDNQWVIDEQNDINKEFYDIITFGFSKLGE